MTACGDMSVPIVKALAILLTTVLNRQSLRRYDSPPGTVKNHVAVLPPSRFLHRLLLRIYPPPYRLVPLVLLLAALLPSPLASLTPFLTFLTSSRLASQAPFLTSLLSFHLASQTPSLASPMPSILLAPQAPLQPKSLHHSGLIHLFLSLLMPRLPRFLLHRHSIPPAFVVLSPCILTPTLSTRYAISPLTGPESAMKVISMFGCVDTTISLLPPIRQLCQMRFKKNWQKIGSFHCSNFRSATSAPLSASYPNVPTGFKRDGDSSSIYPAPRANRSMMAFPSNTELYPTSRCAPQFVWLLKLAVEQR